MATIYYIATTGNDSTGTGTTGNPWKTLSKASSVVTTAGDTIHVNAGTYLETVQCFIAPGVNLVGDGDTVSILQHSWPWSYQAGFVFDSVEGTNGNQVITGIKFDGRNETSPRGISVQGRSNVEIHHCAIVNFKEEGIVFSGTLGFTGNAPGIYAVGNKFHDNTVTNCSQFAGFGTGCLGIGGQNGMLIYNNIIDQPYRAGVGNVGWPIKYFNEGWNRGVKIYNNTLTKGAFDGNGWNFVLEWFNFQGCEIYNNICSGSLDFNFQGDRGTYPWVTYIHDNLIGPIVTNTAGVEQGLIWEYDVDGTIVENNIFRNMATVCTFYCRPATSTKDFVFQKNLAYNIGYASAPSFSYFVGGFDAGTSNYTVDNFKIYNNTFVGMTPAKPNGAIGFGNCNTGFLKNIDIRNNHIENAVFPPLSLGGTATKDNLIFSYNNVLGTDQYGIGTGGGGKPYFPNGAPTNYTTTNNIAVAPSFVGSGNYTLQSGSLLIDAGTNVGLSYSGTAPDIGYAEYASGNATPSVNAGVDQTITLPASTVTLTGTAVDGDGTISSTVWSKLSGPAGEVIISPNSLSTVVNNLSAGTYVFRLLATDNLGGTGSDNIQITVNPVGGANVPPTANAGTDQTITLPVNIVTLSGSGTDSDGTIASYNWSKISGPTSYTITSASTASTTVTSLVAGTYIFRLTVADNLGATGTDDIQITVNPYGGSGPAVYVGLDQTITLPTSSVSLTANTATPAGSGLNYIYQSENLNTSPWNGSSGGVTVTENAGLDLNGNMTMSRLVEPTVASTSLFQLVDHLTPNTTYYLSFDVYKTTMTNADYEIYDWSNFNIIQSETSYIASVESTVSRVTRSFTTPAGCTTVRLSVLRNGFGVGEMYMGRVQLSPVVNDNYAHTTTTQVTSGGSGTTITGHSWSKQSGPTTFTIASPTASSTNVTGLVAGTYVFRDTVTDSAAATAFDDVQITVNSGTSNVPPVANAGSNQTIVLPTSSVTMAGSGTDADGTITSHVWSQFSGPNTANIVTPTSYTTNITGLVAGGYVFRLTVTDNLGSTATSDVLITVTPIPPTQTTIHRKVQILP